ncbi:hypothetical protein TNCV_4866711 [Trichonephila clavipes]|nr:hypothetical protein TNCV_4866711 [Trichonephila clavipes]
MSTFNIPILPFFVHIFLKKQLNLAVGENNSTRPLNSKTKTVAGEKQLNSAEENNSTQQYERNNSTQQYERNNSTQQKKPTQLCAAVYRLYSRIGFSYLLPKNNKEIES